MENNELRFIGHVRSAVQDRREMPAFGAPAAVELLPAFAPALLRIEKHSHLWVLAWLTARPERDVLQVVPRGMDRDQPDALHGVFAVRSPARPNPIGLTAAKVERIEDLKLYFDRLDFLDGTPVLDLKPYFVARDLIFSARNVHIGKPRDRQSRRESLLLQALNFIPEMHPDAALAVRIVEHFGGEITSLRAPLTRPYLVDALIGITRLSFTTGLTLDDAALVEINGLIRYPVAGHVSFDAVMTATDDELFQGVG